MFSSKFERPAENSDSELRCSIHGVAANGQGTDTISGLLKANHEMKFLGDSTRWPVAKVGPRLTPHFALGARHERPMQTENRIRDWLMSFPGLVVSVSPQAVLQEALALFTAATSTEVDLPVFTDSLWRLGFRADQRGADWVLALPEKPNASDSHFRRLRHITG